MFNNGVDQRDTNHIACSVAQSDDDCQLYTLVNRLTGSCDGTIRLEAITPLSSFIKVVGR